MTAASPQPLPAVAPPVLPISVGADQSVRLGEGTGIESSTPLEPSLSVVTAGGAASESHVPASATTEALPPIDVPKPTVRWTVKRLIRLVAERFGRTFCRETIRTALKRLGLSWKKAKKLLSRGDPKQREAFVVKLKTLLTEAMQPDDLLVFIDEGHIHQDADLGYGWSVMGERFWVCSSSPGLHAKVSFYGLYLYNEGQVRIWPYERANGILTIDVMRRLREEFPNRHIRIVWDGAAYHRSKIVMAAAVASMNIELIRLPAYSPDFMPVEALWRWLREDVTYNHCHTTPEELMTRVAEFQARINADPLAVADRLWVKTELDPEEEKLRISK